MIRTALLTAGLVAAAVPALAEVNVYTDRQPFLIQPIFDAFTEQTGTEVNVVFAKSGIAERLEAEGANSPADLVITSDIGHLNDLVERGLAQPVTTETLEAAVPDAYRHPEGLWWGLTKRARVIYASRERVPEGAIETYGDLAGPEWEGRVCTRAGDHTYQVSLVAAHLAHEGPEATRAWLEGLKNNLARKPQGNDRAQVKAIWQGECDVALGNSYYMGKMLEDPEQQEWAESVYIVFPDLAGHGTHMNVSGAAVTKAAPHKADALALLDFMVSDTAQDLYAQRNHEYPVKEGVAPSDLLKSWGDFTGDDIPLVEVAGNRDAALRLVHEVDYNSGP